MLWCSVRSLYSSHMHESLSLSKSLNDLSALYVVRLDKLFKLLWVPFLKTLSEVDFADWGTYTPDNANALVLALGGALNLKAHIQMQVKVKEKAKHTDRKCTYRHSYCASTWCSLGRYCDRVSELHHWGGVAGQTQPPSLLSPHGIFITAEWMKNGQVYEKYIT